MEIITPGVKELQDKQVEENPYLMTNFGFQKSKPANDSQKEFMSLLTSGILWEDGTKLALGLIADRHARPLESKDIIGGIIDPTDDFWQQPSDNDMNLIENMIWHQSYHQTAVVFGRKDEWENPSQHGAGYFRLAIDTSSGNGDHRWAILEFEMTGTNVGNEHRHVQESIDRMKENDLEVWRIDETYPSSNFGQEPRKRMILFTISTDSIDHKKFMYKIGKATMKHLEARLIRNNNRSPIQPSRREEKNMMPVPCMAHPLLKANVEINKM